MIRFVLFFAWCALLLAPRDLSSQESIESERILSHIRFLASDELEGRDSGTPGEWKAAQYIARQFEQLGLEPVGRGKGRSYYQPFRIGDRKTRNVVAWLPGSDPALAHEHVILGGHFDHVGHGQYGSTWGKKGKGLIHNGADDNASGTSVVIEIARALMVEKARPRRSVLFILFSGEERGLLGSQYYVEHPLHPLKDAVAMINLDMVGRGKTGTFTVNGTGSGRGLSQIVESAAKKHRYRIQAIPFGIAPSDNTSFYRKEIPVLFVTTGVHPEYHTPWDDIEWINADNARCVGRFVFDCLRTLSDRPGRVSHRWSELHLPSLVQGAPSLVDLVQEQLMIARNRARLGLTAEDATSGGSGARILAFARAGASERVGLRKGDLIVEIGGRPVHRFGDLGPALAGRVPGEVVEVIVLRDRKRLSFQVRLGRY